MRREDGLVQPSICVRSCSSTRISVIHATRWRPRQAISTHLRWMELARYPGRVEWLFGVDADDDATRSALAEKRVIVSEAGTCVAAWNLGAAASTGQILVQMSDDWEPVMDWDWELARRLPLDRPAVLAVGDGHRTDGLLCMAVLNRARYEQQGHLFAPEYRGVYADNEFSLRAFQDGVVIDARAEVVFRHRHPAYGDAPLDATYARQNAPQEYAYGHEVFVRRNPGA